MVNMPSTKIFFSGSFFPLETLFNMDDHMLFFASELLGRSWSLDCVYEEILLFEAILKVGPPRQEVFVDELHAPRGGFSIPVAAIFHEITIS